MMHCAITGCALVFHGRWIAGDLFDAGDCWIFNGNYRVGSNRAEADWQVGAPYYEKQLWPEDYFEKRGVFVVRKSEANLNYEAIQYISGGPLAAVRQVRVG
jgi:hypothetical protein